MGAGPALVAALPMLQSQVHQHQAIGQAAELHKLAIEQAEAHHHESLSLDIESARKEASRDQWGQKSAGAQTLMIVSTLMFSCVFGILVEGMPPESVGEGWVVAFSATVASSLWFLFLALWLAMKLQARLSKYVIPDPTQLYRCLVDGQTVWRRHPTFESYYQCHCKKITRSAFVLFYVGCLNLLGLAALLLYMRFTVNYTSSTSGAVFIAISGIFCIVLAILNYVLPTKPRDDRALTLDAMRIDVAVPGVRASVAPISALDAAERGHLPAVVKKDAEVPARSGTTAPPRKGGAHRDKRRSASGDAAGISMRTHGGGSASSSTDASGLPRPIRTRDDTGRAARAADTTGTLATGAGRGADAGYGSNSVLRARLGDIGISRDGPAGYIYTCDFFPPEEIGLHIDGNNIELQ